MNLTDAIAKHRDDQYADYARQASEYRIPLTQDEYFSSEENCGAQFAIASEVGMRVGAEMGELIAYGVFDNCREHGITYRAAGPRNGVAGSDPFTGWTFCVYEHRNSDSICVNGCPTNKVESYGPYGGENKYDTLFDTRYENYDEAAAALIAMMRFSAAATRQSEVTRDALRDAAMRMELVR